MGLDWSKRGGGGGGGNLSGDHCNISCEVPSATGLVQAGEGGWDPLQYQFGGTGLVKEEGGPHGDHCSISSEVPGGTGVVKGGGGRGDHCSMSSDWSKRGEGEGVPGVTTVV